jgi:aspartyl-tRNA(Asn)/glutamyl-tRNA(Gln) amidotransferase subunit C
VALGRQDVEYIAKLARLHLSEAEIETYSKHLGAVVEYMEKLKELDTSGVSATSHAAAVESAFRADFPGACMPREELLQNAPQVKGDFFAVPKVIG